MFTTPRTRAVAIATLLGILFVMTVWLGSLPPDPETNSFPSQDELSGEYDRYVGEKVVVSGEIVTTDPLVIESKLQNGESFRLSVRDVSEPVERGETLRVFGVVEEGRTIHAINAFTVPRHGHWYAWVVSFIAGLWVLNRLLRHWRFDRNEAGLEPRPTIGTPYDRVRKWWASTEETDA